MAPLVRVHRVLALRSPPSGIEVHARPLTLPGEVLAHAVIDGEAIRQQGLLAISRAVVDAGAAVYRLLPLGRRRVHVVVVLEGAGDADG